MAKYQKIKFEFNDKTYTIKLKKVENQTVTIKVESEIFDLNINQTKKIDLNNDGYYDLQISVNEVRSNGYADLEFKEIHEEVPAEEKEEQESPIKIEEVKIK